ncbi:MAG: PqqD family protein [Acidobacteria bacterium]|nr:PqqD family protein [Acidobacteriota bacterium]
MKFSLQDTVRISEDVVFRELDGEAVLLNLASGIYFGLNEVGTRIWTLLGQDGALQRVFDAMKQQYDVVPERLEKDLLELVEQMYSKGLVQEHLPTPV